MTPELISLIERAFPGMDRTGIQQLAALARPRTYPPNTVLCHEGEYEDVLYLFETGEAVISKRFSDVIGDELVLRYARAGDYVGEMAIISDAPRSATVRTTTESDVYEIDREIFRKVLGQNPEIALHMVKTTFERIRENDRLTIAELRKAFQTLERLDRAKLDFIEVTAHELRTPLTIMRGYASMMLTDPLIRENLVLREMVEGIASGSQRLHEIVNNMLDVQRIDLEQVAVASVPVSLPVVLRGVEMEFKQAMQQRQITFKSDAVQGSEPVYIEADPGLLTKAMHHIVMNAIKYTPDGGTITLALTYEDHPHLERVAHISVTDTGIGIDPEFHSLIFEKFYRLGDVQLHSSGKTAFKAGGPGLGLAIAKGVVLAHGGEIWVESSGYNEAAMPGSVFHVMIPVKAELRNRLAMVQGRRME
ncbi:MAG: hypothetical protein OHK0023_04050 [Anaerolineae bacterium]